MYAAPDMAPVEEDINRAKARLAAWLRWYLATYSEKYSSQNSLADALGISRPTLVYILERGSSRTASIPTLVRIKRLTGISIDTLLFTDPPPIPHR